MDLEQRVETLEQELQILKNQIQTTLLDIQEQLLTNAYPSLRAEDMMPESTTPPSSKNGAPITTLSFNAPRDEFHGGMSEDNQSVPSVRQVSLNDLGPVDETRKPTVPKAGPTPQPTASDNEHWQNIEALEEWATDKMKTIGLKRTKKLVKMYAEQGHFSAEEEQTLLQFVSLFEHEQRQNSRAKDAAPQRKAQAAERPARSKPATNSTSPVKQMQTAEKTRPVRPAKPVAPPPPETAPEDEIFDDSETNLVLKLIAGVQNAGAGVRWSKKKNG